MRRYVLALALFGGAALASEPNKELTKKEIGKLMKDAHHGDKSPQARVAAELKKAAPDWAQLTTDAKAFAAMGEAFKSTNLGYKSPYEYIDSATALTKATGNKDKKAATDAFSGLNKSCVGCHNYGAPK